MRLHLSTDIKCFIVSLKRSEAQEDDGDSTTSTDGSETTEESAAGAPDTTRGESVPEQVR